MVYKFVYLKFMVGTKNYCEHEARDRGVDLAP
jgi:hypothetical protein